MRAVDVMARDVVAVRPDTDVAEAIRLLAEHDVSALSVLDDAGNLVGMLSEADLIPAGRDRDRKASTVVARSDDRG